MSEITLRGKISALFWENKLSLAVVMAVLLTVVMALPVVGVLIAFACVLFALAIGLKDGSVGKFGFRRPGSWFQTVIFAFFMGAVIELCFQIFFNPFFESITGEPIDLSAFDPIRGNIAAWALGMLAGWGIGGVLEEMTFRGYLITRLKKLMGENSLSLIAIVMITSIPFGVAHLYQGWAGVLSTGCIAVIFGIIFIKSKYNLWLPILTHGFVNTVGLTLIYLDWDVCLRNMW